MTLAMASALAILVITYIFLFLDKIHRTIIGLAGATAMLLVGKLLRFYQSIPTTDHPDLTGTALGAIDWNTMGLLFGMLVIGGILEETGVFEYISIRIAKMTRGNYWLLLLALSWFAFLASTLFNNVTTIIFVGSITLSISSILRVNPVPLLISEAIMSGVGGMATLIGDPPNVMIGSAAGFTFLDFVLYLAPIAIAIGLGTCLIFRWLYRHDLSHEVEDPKGLMEMSERDAIQEPVVLRRILIVFAGVLVLFVVPQIFQLLPSEVAMAGAAVALVWVRPDLLEILNKIKWDVLLFFAGLFVIVGGLEAAGVLDLVAHSIGGLVKSNPILALLVVLWGSALFSAIIDNIPFTIALIPIITTLGSMGISIIPLWWALAAGVALGGCATPMGASANVYVMSLSESKGLPIGFQGWMRVGVPVVLGQLVIASLILLGMLQLGLI
ncbi:ArsB/NhaD family transporter [Candidatus Acetothermia bacterium]|nr:ArsB/NhaD family transporter [Candidatus Acetothermia bacterium]MBI3643843.1 ArsB/NhaD family transporter [Candidatus Acetothermia bacterium]